MESPFTTFQFYFFLSRKSTNCERAAFTQTLDIMGRSDIGCVLEGSSGSPDLRIGMTSANFHTWANVFKENEVLTRFVILASVIGNLSFNILVVTVSWPGALFDWKDLIIFPTSFSITG